MAKTLKLKKGQKVYRATFVVFADIVLDTKTPDFDPEDEANDAGYNCEFLIEEVLEREGCQNAQAGLDSVVTAPKHAQVRVV